MTYRKRGLDGKELLDYLRSRCVVTENGCWLWQGCISDGRYGSLKYKGRIRRAHCVTYELSVGPVPDNLELDHTCKVTTCINPEHLEPVTHKVNVQRGDLKHVSGKRYAAQTHCIHGHPYEPHNLYLDKKGHKSCRTCARDRNRAARQVKKLQSMP